MAQRTLTLIDQGFAATRRRDAWWVEPLAVFLGYTLFTVYANYAILENNFYEVAGTNYLSPMYSPLLFRETPSWWPAPLPYSAAWFIMWAPLGMRLTCYYYRGAYYKGFWADPPSCGVGEPRVRRHYRGERRLPLILQNVHRYFLYLAIAFVAILTSDAWKAFWFDGPAGPGTRFGIGVGTLVMLVNPVLIGLYTFSCHSLRHLVGGRKDALADAPLQRACYGCVSAINAKHMQWAWVSMFYVGFVDLYIRLVAKGIWTDVRIF
jgi:hypothetical protein